MTAGCSKVTTAGGIFLFLGWSKRFFAADLGKIGGILRVGLAFFVLGTGASFDNVTRLFLGRMITGAKCTLSSGTMGCVNGITRGSGRKAITSRCKMAATSSASSSRQFSATSRTRRVKHLPISVRCRLGLKPGCEKKDFYSRVSWFFQSGVDVLHHYLLACSCYFEPAHSLYLPT